MSKEQIEEMVKIIDQAKHDMWVGECPTYAEHSKNIAKYLYAAGYRKQSEKLVEVVRCYDCRYCEVVVDSIIDEPKYFCTRMVGSMPIDPTDYCSQAKMKGGAEE